MCIFAKSTLFLYFCKNQTLDNDEKNHDFIVSAGRNRLVVAGTRLAEGGHTPENCQFGVVPPWSLVARQQRGAHQRPWWRRAVPQRHLLLVWRAQVGAHEQRPCGHQLLLVEKPHRLGVPRRGTPRQRRKGQRPGARLRHGASQSDFLRENGEVCDVASPRTQGAGLRSGALCRGSGRQSDRAFPIPLLPKSQPRALSRGVWRTRKSCGRHPAGRPIQGMVADRCRAT